MPNKRLSFRISSVVHGAGAVGFMENLGEVARGGKTQNEGDLGDGKVGFCQEVFTFLNAAGDQIIDGRNPIFLLESMREVVFVHVCFLGELI